MRTRALLHVTLPILLLSALTAPAQAGDKDNVFVDVDRSISKQEDAAKAAEATVKEGVGRARDILLLLNDKCAPVRDATISALCKSWSDDDLLKLSVGLKARESFLLEGLAEVYEVKAIRGAAADLAKAISNARDEDSAVAILRALSVVGGPEEVAEVGKLVKRERRSFRIKGEALRTLALLDKDNAVKHLNEGLEDKLLPVRIIALVTLEELDEAKGAEAAVAMIRASQKERDEAWAPRLLFAALDTLRATDDRPALEAPLRAAIEAMIEVLEGARGREQFELGQTLKDLTGEIHLAPDHLAWKTWWEARKDEWKPDKKKRDTTGDDEGSPGGSVVRFHGVPIHSLRIAFAQDISGGMTTPVGGRGTDTPTELEVSKKELDKVLSQLSDEALVNLLYFATFFHECAKEPVPLKNKRNRAVLQAFNAKQTIPTESGHGRSNLFDTIRFGITQPGIDTLFMLTEGGPTEGKYIDTDRFMKHLARLNVFYRARVHTLLIADSSTGRRFLKELAANTGGRFYDIKDFGKDAR